MRVKDFAYVPSFGLFVFIKHCNSLAKLISSIRHHNIDISIVLRLGSFR